MQTREKRNSKAIIILDTFGRCLMIRSALFSKELGWDYVNATFQMSVCLLEFLTKVYMIGKGKTLIINEYFGRILLFAGITFCASYQRRGQWLSNQLIVCKSNRSIQFLTSFLHAASSKMVPSSQKQVIVRDASFARSSVK